MRSCINFSRNQNGSTTEGAKSVELFAGARKKRLMGQLGLVFPMLIVLILTACDQVPTTLDEEPYLGDSGETTFSAEISRFEFDYLSRQFFFSVEVTSPVGIEDVVYNLGMSGSAYVYLNDLGQDADILIGDGRYDGSWILPDSMSSYMDSLWTLEIIARDQALNSLTVFKSLQPVRPSPPLIVAASHLDTLTLPAAGQGLTIDTLWVEISHPGGLDEIRDVSMMSLKPDGTYANGGQPIPLYDDGGSVVFYSFEGIDFTSGDSLANDGVYSLLLALAPNNLSGVYHWSFHSRSWLGIEATPLLDSIIVLPAGSLSRPVGNEVELKGVFQ